MIEKYTSLSFITKSGIELIKKKSFADMLEVRKPTPKLRTVCAGIYS